MNYISLSLSLSDSMKILINRRQQDRGALNPFENLNAYWSWQDQHEETGMGNLRMANSSRSAGNTHTHTRAHKHTNANTHTHISWRARCHMNYDNKWFTDDEPVAANMYNHDMPYVRVRSLKSEGKFKSVKTWKKNYSKFFS